MELSARLVDDKQANAKTSVPMRVIISESVASEEEMNRNFSYRTTGGRLGSCDEFIGPDVIIMVAGPTIFSVLHSAIFSHVRSLFYPCLAAPDCSCGGIPNGNSVVLAEAYNNNRWAN